MNAIRLKAISSLVVAIPFLFWVQAAVGWNPHGHRVIASIAFLRLEPATRLSIAERIKNHPRWNEDFAAQMPELVKGDPQMQAEWIFQQAACWPDTTRQLPDREREKYDHGSWHYINKIVYLNPGDKDSIGPVDINQATRPPLKQSKDMNAVQAIEFARLRVNGEIEVSAEQDALMLCWLLHSYSDLHQPLHSTSMFSETLLPDGCRGGNRIKTIQSKNLHALWDGLLGNDASFRDCHNQALRMMNDKALVAYAKLGAGHTSGTAVWIGAHINCIQFTFAGEVRAHLQKLESAGETELPPINLSDAYLKTAGRVARRQGIRAGWRLGELLQ